MTQDCEASKLNELLENRAAPKWIVTTDRSEIDSQADPPLPQRINSGLKILLLTINSSKGGRQATFTPIIPPTPTGRYSVAGRVTAGETKPIVHFETSRRARNRREHPRIVIFAYYPTPRDKLRGRSLIDVTQESTCGYRSLGDRTPEKLVSLLTAHLAVYQRRNQQYA
ncbi:hypothetical protein BDQ12DRAFT_663112 [Crucibulum laeve]|uniref:Uncharacterized protein n=1 Tax=Crucibulum laeve TaxID=68775 RepID=A0A5C3MDL6_9AGAR|nr:hypothetical protein BDQ12DRAFT_663112 [Crucibulum laeve]